MAVNSVIGMPLASAPSDSMRDRNSGALTIATTSVCSRWITACGVPAGAKMPHQPVTSKPGRPDSAIVGISGMPAARLGVLTAIPRTFPLRTCGMIDPGSANIVAT